MKARVLTAVVGNDFLYSAGQVLDSATVPVQRIEDLVRAGHAELLGESPKVEKAVLGTATVEKRKKQ